MEVDETIELKIPEGINYECTSCGKCCSGWSVPLTEEDYERLAVIDWGQAIPDLKGKKLFRQLKPNERLNTPYSHAINPEPNGVCPFLKNNLCSIHSQFGAQIKPAICQLFPYSFNETPSGIFVTVSFISRGAIYNAGRALIDQREYLEAKYREFKKLFPDHHPNWSTIKLSSNLPLSWAEYENIEAHILSLMQDKSKSLGSRFLAGSEYLNSLLVSKTNGLSQKTIQDQRDNLNETKKPRLNNWDKILLSTLYKMYFPEQDKLGKSYGQLNLGLGSFIKGAMNTASIDQMLSAIASIDGLENDEQINDFIYRFFYARIFAKLYFGAGFGQLSLIAGFNHLAVAFVLLKLKMQQNALQRKSSEIIIDDVVSAIVQLEKSLGELKISPYGAALLELLLASKQRMARIPTLP